MAFEIYEPEIKPQEKQQSQRSNLAQSIASGAGVAGRAFEGAVGAPGSLASIATSIADYATGGRVGSYEEARKKYPYLPPTVSELRQSTQRLTGKELEPKSRTEESVQNVAQKLGTGFSSGVGFLPNIAMSIGGEIVKQGAKSLGAPESLQTIAELASELFLGGKLTNRSLQNKGTKAHEALKNLTPAEKSLQTAVPHTEKAINDLLRKGNLGLSTPGKEFAIKKADEFANKIQKGKVSFDDFQEYTEALNNLAYEATIPSGTKNYLERLGIAARKDIKDLSKKNPQFKNLQLRNEINHAFSAAKEASQFINTKISDASIGDVTKELLKALTLPALGYGTYGKGAAALGGLATLGKKQYNFYKTLISKSPEAQKAYGNLITSALRENADGVDKALKRFDSALEKQARFEILD